MKYLIHKLLVTLALCGICLIVDVVLTIILRQSGYPKWWQDYIAELLVVFSVIYVMGLWRSNILFGIDFLLRFAAEATSKVKKLAQHIYPK